MRFFPVSALVAISACAVAPTELPEASPKSNPGTDSLRAIHKDYDWTKENGAHLHNEYGRRISIWARERSLRNAFTELVEFGGYNCGSDGPGEYDPIFYVECHGVIETDSCLIELWVSMRSNDGKTGMVHNTQKSVSRDCSGVDLDYPRPVESDLDARTPIPAAE